jgi:hypothetical protein
LLFIRLSTCAVVKLCALTLFKNNVAKAEIINMRIIGFIFFEQSLDQSLRLYFNIIIKTICENANCKLQTANSKL